TANRHRIWGSIRLAGDGQHAEFGRRPHKALSTDMGEDAELEEDRYGGLLPLMGCHLFKVFASATE
ncbi:MAG: hypothetical protein ACRDKE_12815, partial [Solirubrobacterales bacterium]